MRPKGSGKELEVRRFLAVPLLKKGRSLSEVAGIIGCHPSSVMRWRDALHEHGDAGLRAKPVPGRPTKLTPRQIRRLVRVLLKGAMAPRAMKLIREWTSIHTDELKENWERARSNMPLNWIEPLR